MKLRILWLSLVCIAGCLFAQAAFSAEGALNTNHVGAVGKKVERRTLKSCLQPAVKDGGFRMDDFILWCPSVIKVGDTYHMFASRWPAQYGLGGWTSHSECVRATATNYLGPYAFQEVVLQKRPDNWDNSRVH